MSKKFALMWCEDGALQHICECGRQDSEIASFEAEGYRAIYFDSDLDRNTLAIAFWGNQQKVIERYERIIENIIIEASRSPVDEVNEEISRRYENGNSI